MKLSTRRKPRARARSVLSFVRCMLELLDGPVRGLFVQAPAAVPELGFAFDLRTTHLVHSRAAEGDDVEAVEADLGFGKVLGGAGLKRGTHIHAGMADGGWLSTVFGDVVGEFSQRRLVFAGRRKRQACVEVMKA